MAPCKFRKCVTFLKTHKRYKRTYTWPGSTRVNYINDEQRLRERQCPALPTHLKLDVAADAAGAARTLDPENGVTLGVTDVELGLADAPALFDVADGFARRRLHFHFLWK